MAKGLGARVIIGACAVAACVVLAPASALATGGFSEGFTTMPPSGWTIVNNSNPIGTQTWQDGTRANFTAQDAATTNFAYVDYDSTGHTGDISNWLISPGQTGLTAAQTYSFWTRTFFTGIADRLELRLSTDGNCNPGSSSTDVGDFTTLLTSVNPNLDPSGYPDTWTQFTGDLSGIPADAQGCFAFRYFVTDGGFNGANSQNVGVDTFSTNGGFPMPTPPTLTGATPASPSNSTSPTITGNDPVSGGNIYIYDNSSCSGQELANATASDFNSNGVTVPVQANQTTQLYAQASDALSKRSICTILPFSYTNDSTPPDTSITGGPGDGTVTTSSLASFTYSGDPVDDTNHFRCALDANPPSNCPNTGATYNSLPDGQHTFSVAAVDGVGNIDATPATVTWTIDTHAPSVDTLGAKVMKAKDQVKVTFTGSDPNPGTGVADFGCSFDGKAFRSCASPRTYKHVQPGKHKVLVHAIDGAGNTSANSKVTFKMPQ